MQKKRNILIIILGAAVIACATLIIWDVPRNKFLLLFEKEAIEKTARQYFKSEMDRDHKQVYALLAPSSIYRKDHTYQQFIQEATESKVIIHNYRIVDIYRLRDNDNRKDYPSIDKFVQVEVDMEISFRSSGAKSTYNYCFTFLKEKGAWYKG